MSWKIARNVLATVLGAFVLIAWGMVFWGLLADPLGLFHRIPNSEAVTKLLKENDTQTGTYFRPWPRNTPESFKRFSDLHKEGPFYKLSYIKEGVDPNSPAKLTIGCLHYLTVAAIAVGILSLVQSMSLLVRVAVVFLSGLMGTNFISAGDPVWFHLPWDYAGGSILYETVSWLLLGIVTGLLVKPDVD